MGTLFASELQSQAVAPLYSWNRPEARPRAKEFEQSLKAEVRDPLWFLARQWQWGEFKGENTGTAITAKTHFKTSKITQIAPHGNIMRNLDEGKPLEMQIESIPVHELNVKERARVGQRWKTMLRQAFSESAAADYFAQFIARDGFTVPDEPTTVDLHDVNFIQTARILADEKQVQILASLAGRTIDGALLIKSMVTEHKQASFGITANANDTATLNQLGVDFVYWVNQTYGLVNSQKSWSETGMEYRFACRIPNKDKDGNYYTEVINAREYASGRLDWDAFDIANEQSLDMQSNWFDDPNGTEKTKVLEERPTTYPTGIAFPGMPADRWWEFEDSQVNFGKVIPDTTDILSMMLMEFSLIYSNEWNIIPHKVPVGSITEAPYVIVTDSFGKKVLIEHAANAEDDAWDVWGMFHLSKEGTDDGARADNRIFFPPVLSKQTQETEPTERVRFIRDEMANLVWGVESTIPHFWAGGKDAVESMLDYNQYLAGLAEKTGQVSPLAPIEGVPYKYQLMNTVPDHWIPFMPVKTNDQAFRQIQLQRAAMPKMFEGVYDKPPFPKVRPQSLLLRAGLDPFNEQVQLTPMYINEEEVPRAGAEVSAAWQRARWYNGKVCNWYSRKKTVGRGEGNSGLAFDELTYKKSN